MMESGFEASFPLIFYDGNATLHMGNVFINPFLNFKAFQLIVSQRIGVSPNQLTVYYERGTLPCTLGKYCGRNRRSPVTSKFNFASIILDCNCFFFVVLKRSRRVRNRNKKQNLSNCSMQNSRQYIQFGMTDYLEYRPSLLERDRYLISRDLNSCVYYDLNQRIRSSVTGEDEASSSGGVSSSGVFCGICASSKREGQTASFHLCSSDAVITTWFRSPFGPIARPEIKLN